MTTFQKKNVGILTLGHLSRSEVPDHQIDEHIGKSPEKSRKIIEKIPKLLLKIYFRHEKLIFFFQIFFPRKISMVTIDSARLYVHPMLMQRWCQRKPSRSPESGVTGIFSRAASYNILEQGGLPDSIRVVPMHPPHCSFPIVNP